MLVNGKCRLGRQVAWFILFADNRMGVQVKLCGPSSMRAVPQRFWGEVLTVRRCSSCPHLYTFSLQMRQRVQLQHS